MYWKQIPLDTFPENKATSFNGIPWLPSKEELPVLWRFVWPWHVFLICSVVNEPYYALFRSGDIAMRREVTTKIPYVGVRLGNGDVSFVFTSVDGRPFHTELQTSEHPIKRSETRQFGENITLV